MKLVDVLNKIHLGGINEVCVVEKDGSVAVTSPTNAVLTYIRPKKSLRLSHPLGIRDVPAFIKVLSPLGEKDSITIGEHSILVKDGDGKVDLKVSDVEAVPRLDDPMKLLKELKKELNFSASILRSRVEKLRRKFDQLKPEIITLRVGKEKKGKRKLTCVLGEAIGNVGYVDIAMKARSSSDKSCETIYRASHLMAILAAADCDKFSVALGNKMPLMVEAELSDCHAMWCLSPYEQITA